MCIWNYLLLFVCFYIVPEELCAEELLQVKRQSRYLLTSQISMQGDIKRARVPQRLKSRTLVHENLLDQIDVYALSPHAKKLSLPHMISKSVIDKVAKGEITLPADWEAIIQTASKRHSLDPAIIAAVIKVESGFSQKALSPKGAQGPMQVMPETGLELGTTDLFDPNINVDAGSRYLRQQLDRFGSLELALAAYNAGPGAVIKYGGIPPYRETQSFVKKVLSAL